MRKKKPVIYAPRPSPEYSCGKRNPLFPIRAASFVSIALYVIFKPPALEYECGKKKTLYPIRANYFVSIIMHLTLYKRIN
jgi:hypothetical protein